MTKLSDESPNKEPVKADFCPDLGMEGDSTTVLHYPAEWNYCYHVSPAQTPKFKHQSVYCLHINYVNCPVYKAPAGEHLPNEFRYRHKIPARTLSILRKVVLGLFLMGLLSVVFFNRDLIRTEVDSFLMPGWQRTQMAAPAVTMTPNQLTTPTSLPVPTDTQVPTLASTSLPTMTPTRPRPVLAPGVPIGDEFIFVIYQVVEGDTLDLIANRFNTNAAAIRASTLFLLEVLWAELYVVIPVDRTDVADLPIFDPYEVTVAQITVEGLAEMMEVDLEALIFYNHLWPGFQLQQGDWVLLPYARD